MYRCRSDHIRRTSEMPYDSKLRWLSTLSSESRCEIRTFFLQLQYRHISVTRADCSWIDRFLHIWNLGFLTYSTLKRTADAATVHKCLVRAIRMIS